MNIFYLDPCPRRSALWHNDRHEVKMILESGQMLSAVLHRHGIEDDRLYKLTHKNHPSTLWAGDSIQHFWWLKDYSFGLTSNVLSVASLHTRHMIDCGNCSLCGICMTLWTTLGRLPRYACRMSSRLTLARRIATAITTLQSVTNGCHVTSR